MKRKKTAGKLGYLVLEQIVKIIIFGIMSILCFDQEGLGIVNHIGGGIFVYSAKTEHSLRMSGALFR